MKVKLEIDVDPNVLADLFSMSVLKLQSVETLMLATIRERIPEWFESQP